MSGIFGYFNLHKRSIADNKIAEIITTIKSERYSITEVTRSNSCLLGESDIESFRDKEPINKEERNGISLVICGEIYNEDIKDVNKWILHLYEQGKLGLLSNLNGSFAVAIYDSVKEKLTVANDRYGLIKLFYYYGKNYCCFAPKVGLLIKLGAERSLRKDAVIDFFLFGYLLGDKTFFDHIHQLPPASILEISGHGMKITKYWDYKYNEECEARPTEELIDELGRLWQRAVERRIKKDEEIIIPLSGGLDSRAILAAALRYTSKDKITTFTFGERGSFDSDISKIVSEKAGVRHILLVSEKNDFEEQYKLSMDDIEGMIDTTPYFAIKGYEKMKNHGNTLFTGTMIDVLLGRHILSSLFTPMMLKEEIATEEDYVKVKEFIFKRQILNDENMILKLFNPDLLRNVNIRASFDRTHQQFENIINSNSVNYFVTWDYTNRWNKYIYFAVLRNRNLFKYQTMLDTDLVDFTFRLSPELRLDENLYIQMLLKKYPELFELPTKTNLGLRLDASDTLLFVRRATLFFKVIANRISRRFIQRNIFKDQNKNYIDYDNLLRVNREYRNYINIMIEKVAQREYFNKDYIKEIWNLHMQGKKNYSMLFGLLVTFELLLERFVDE